MYANFDWFLSPAESIKAGVLVSSSVISLRTRTRTAVGCVRATRISVKVKTLSLQVLLLLFANKCHRFLIRTSFILG